MPFSQNTYVDSEVLPEGYEMQLFDPFTDEEVTVRVTGRAEAVQVNACRCHPSWQPGFEAVVIDGPNPGRVVRGFTQTFDTAWVDADSGEIMEAQDVCAFLLRSRD